MCARRARSSGSITGNTSSTRRSRFLPAVSELEDAAMLEKAVHKGDDPDVLAHPLHSGTQNTGSAHVEVNSHAGVRGVVQRVDDRLVHEGVHFRADLTRILRGRFLDLAADQAQESRAHAERRHRDHPPRQRLRVAGDDVEERGQIATEVLIGGEKAQIGVLEDRPLVVVPRTQVGVPLDPSGAAPHDQERLRVRLEPREAVQHLHARVLQPLPRTRVSLLVEPRL